jgi:predicted dehydrogenase
MIRWGVLGAASIARRRVIPAIQSSSNGRVTAVASRDPDRARALAAELDLPIVHDNYEALLADPEIDAIYLPLLNNDHHRWTIAAAEAGKHILCEKPFAMNAAEAEEMVVVAERAGVLLAEAFMYRFHPRIVKLLSLIEAGTIGDIHLIRSTFTFGPLPPGHTRLDPALGGGALMDVGSYAVNLARLISGQEPESVTALAHYGGTGVDETFAGILSFGSGMLGAFDVSLASQFGVGFEVIGSIGKLVVPQGVRPETNQSTELHLERGMEREVITIEPADQYCLMVEDFADAILTQRPVRFGPDDAVANMRALDALRASAREHARARS